MDYIYYIEIIGIVSFAISGALEGIKNKLDLLGVIILGIISATGGGVIRDLILGITPPTSIKTGTNVYIAIVVSLIIFIISKRSEKLTKKNVSRVLEDFLVISDALGLAVFTIAGMKIAYLINPNYSAFLYAFVGVISGVGGGIIRDLITNNVPYIMDRHVYASASIVGALVFHYGFRLELLPNEMLVFICILLIFAIRMFAYKGKWNLPKAT